jgi:IS5 family transposase
MHQETFTDIEYSNRKKTTKREQFLDMMDKIIPWSAWIAMIEPFYPNGHRGRPPIGIEKMLRMYLLQLWFNLSDEGVEDAIYDSYALRKFSHVDFLKEQVPDATTLLKFRHLLETNGIGKKIFEDINTRLDAAGLIMHGGTIVDASIIAAAPSTKNKKGERDPEMHQTKKGNQWYFGMKVHTGVDAGSGYVHTVEATPANVHDIDEASKLIREDDHSLYGDSGYLGLEKRPEIKEDSNFSSMEYHITRRPSSIRMPASYEGINWDKQIDKRKSSVRCKVEHPYNIVKNLFGYRKVRYRGIAKNLHRFHLLFGCANLVMCMRAGRTKEFCSITV